MATTNYQSVDGPRESDASSSSAIGSRMKLSTRCPACQTLLNFPQTSAKRQITCPRPWCKLKFNPLEEQHWPATDVAPPPRGKDQRTCFYCQTLCNFHKGVNFFICPKCHRTTYVDFKQFMRRAYMVSAVGFVLLLAAVVLLAGLLAHKWKGLEVLIPAIVCGGTAAIVLIYAVWLYRKTVRQQRNHKHNTERSGLLTNIGQIS